MLIPRWHLITCRLWWAVLLICIGLSSEGVLIVLPAFQIAAVRQRVTVWVGDFRLLAILFQGSSVRTVRSVLFYPDRV